MPPGGTGGFDSHHGVFEAVSLAERAAVGWDAKLSSDRTV
jgi:hypothetical protein